MTTKTCKPMTLEENKLILANNKEGKSISEIAGIVRRSKSVVCRVISRFKTENRQAFNDFQKRRSIDC